MAKFIENDLNKAEEYIKYSTEDTNILPDLACVYGLKARLYMWLEDYTNAAKYAKLAFTTTSSKPMTESDCLDAQKVSMTYQSGCGAQNRHLKMMQLKQVS